MQYRSLLILWLGISVVWGLASCQTAPTTTPVSTATCQTNLDCSDFRSCVSGVCVTTSDNQESAKQELAQETLTILDAHEPTVQDQGTEGSLEPEPDGGEPQSEPHAGPERPLCNPPCSNGEICTQGICVKPPCQQDTACASGEICEVGKCIQGCRKDDDCGQGNLCENKRCQPGNCRNNQDCQGGLVCLKSTCTNCTQTSDCPGGLQCLNDSKSSQKLCKIVLSQYQSASRWSDGSHAQHCKGYQTPPSSLHEVSSPTSGAYWIQPGGVTAPYKVYCEMKLEGGGWNLLFKANGSKNTFGYDKSIWTDTSLLDETKVNDDPTEAKYPSFLNLSFKEMLLVFVYSGDSTIYTLTIQARQTQTSLQDAMKQNKYIPFDVTGNRDGWHRLMRNYSAIQRGCQRQGFNVRPSSDTRTARVRIGIVGDENGCKDPDSRIGVGGAGSSCSQDSNITVGHAGSSYLCGSRDKSGRYIQRAAFAYVLAR